MDILSIGNSFSQDAQRYLHDIARSDGVELNTTNLYIGGCSLSRHYRNMLSEERAYELETDGKNTGFNVSLREALLNRDWDLVTIQQVSQCAPYYETYQPYLDKLAEFVRECVPKAKLAIHQTWAYEENSERLNKELGYKHAEDMFGDIEKSYRRAKEDISADFIIPSGELMQSMIKSGIEKVHRDTFHATLGTGRYAIGLLWYAKITGNDIKNNTFSDFDEDVPEQYINIVKKCVDDICSCKKN